MTDTIKSTGADCPKCGDPWPAEYAMAGQPPQWKCVCGAGGPLQGAFAGRERAAKATAAAPQVKKHWSQP